jgi:hypothetical protein
MLRESSQKSNIEIQESEFSSQIILRPRFKDYSQKEDLAFLDEHYKLNAKSDYQHGKTHRVLRS